MFCFSGGGGVHSERPESSWSCQESGRGSAHLWHRTSQRLRQPSPSGRNPNKPASSRRHSSRHLPPATRESTVQKRPARFLMPAFMTGRNLPLRHERQPTSRSPGLFSAFGTCSRRGPAGTCTWLHLACTLTLPRYSLFQLPQGVGPGSESPQKCFSLVALLRC